MAQDDKSAKDRPIGVFDSGIGGLSVVRHILEKLPNEGIVYFGDSARVPYGNKSPETVVRFSIESTRFLLHRDIKFLVVACNTSSAVALPTLERSFRIPKVGVIHPAVHKAIHVTRNGRIGIIGTHATVQSAAYETSLRTHRPDIRVMIQACPLFVPLAEEGWLDGEIPEQIVRHYLEPILEVDVDTIILGCTHYPLLKELIQKVAGNGVTLVESGEAAVAEMAHGLHEAGLLRGDDDPPIPSQYFVSDIPLLFREVGERFLGQPLEHVTRVDQVDLPWFDR
jgi:glutamate racemase